MDMFFFFVFKQKTAYEMRISDWSSDVCSSDLASRADCGRTAQPATTTGRHPERAPESIARRGPGERSPRRPQHPCQRPFRSYGRAVALPHRKLLRRPGLRRQPPVTKIARSEEHTSELQSLMRTPYAVICLKKKTTSHSMNISKHIYTV